MKIEKYDPSAAANWNNFVRDSKNGTFLFDRNYMEYHADRFTDYSLMCYDDKERLLALLPATVKGNAVISHGGLTYGGIVCNAEMKTATMLKLFDALLDFLRKDGKERLVYKAIPHIFHVMPAEEDLYALFVNKAKLFRRDASSAIYLSERMKFAKGKREGVRKALRNNIIVRESRDFKTFFEIGRKVMNERHNLAPIHSGDEMELLSGRFPGNIKLYASFAGEEMLAGVLTFVFSSCVHIQYMYNFGKGLEVGALDIILDQLVNDVYSGYRYMSFGVSTEKNGTYLNEGLIHQKEMIGARSVVHDFYEMVLQ
jgi:hypothetical protein